MGVANALLAQVVSALHILTVNPQPGRSKSSSCHKNAASFLRAPKSVRSRYLRRSCPAFLHADSTHLQVRRVLTRALDTIIAKAAVTKDIKRFMYINDQVLTIV